MLLGLLFRCVQSPRGKRLLLTNCTGSDWLAAKNPYFIREKEFYFAPARRCQQFAVRCNSIWAPQSALLKLIHDGGGLPTVSSHSSDDSCHVPCRESLWLLLSCFSSLVRYSIPNHRIIVCSRELKPRSRMRIT